MSQDDVIQIRVGDSLVGIIGLKLIMQDMAEEYGEKTDREVWGHGNTGSDYQRQGKVSG